MSHCFGFRRFGYDSNVLYVQLIVFVQFVYEQFKSFFYISNKHDIQLSYVYSFMPISHLFFFIYKRLLKIRFLHDCRHTAQFSRHLLNSEKTKVKC